MNIFDTIYYPRIHCVDFCIQTISGFDFFLYQTKRSLAMPFLLWKDEPEKYTTTLFEIWYYVVLSLSLSLSLSLV